MITSKSPFASPTAAETIAAILHIAPLLPSQVVAGIPPTIDNIASKALNKRREDRYQTAEELQNDLARLKLDLDISAKSLYEIHPTPDLRVRIGKDSKWRQIVTMIAAMLVLAIGAYSVISLSGLIPPAPLAPSPPAFRETMRLTTTGIVNLVALSPDSKYFAYVVANESKKQSLWLRQVSANNPLPIVRSEEIIYEDLTFSPDGDSVYYVVRKDGEAIRRTLYQIPVLGGTARKLVEEIDSPVSFSPTGSHFAFARGSLRKGEIQLITADKNGLREKRLATSKYPEFCYTGIAWSPSGKIIVCSSKNNSSNEDFVNLISISESDGAVSKITPTPWSVVKSLAWLNDESGLLVVAQEKGSVTSQIFYVSYINNTIHKLTTNLTNYNNMSLSADSKTMIATKTKNISNIWTQPAFGDVRPVRQITDGTETYYDLDWARNGKIIASGIVDDKLDVFELDVDRQNMRRITFSPLENFRGQISPDNRYVVWVSKQTGAYNIWRMDLDGSNAMRLTSGSGEFSPQITPDSRWVFYYSPSDQPVLWKVSIEGGPPVQFTDYFSRHPTISPDGKLVACYYLNHTSKLKVAIVPIAGGQPVKVLDIPGFMVRWTADGESLAYIGANEQNIWIKPLNGAPAKQLTNFKSDKITFFDWSHTNQIACLRESVISEIVLFKN